MRFIINYFDKVLAQDWTFEVETSTPDTYVNIAGVQSFSMSYDKKVADTTTYDSNGVAEHIPSEVAFKMTIDCLYDTALHIAAAGGIRDEGQLLVETLAAAVGSAGIGKFKVTNPELVNKIFQASAAITEGGTKDASTFKITLTVTGAVVRTVPTT